MTIDYRIRWAVPTLQKSVRAGSDRTVEERVDRDQDDHQQADAELARGAEQASDECRLADRDAVVVMAAGRDFPEVGTREGSRRPTSKGSHDGADNRDRKSDHGSANAAGDRSDDGVKHPATAAAEALYTQH